VGHAVIPAHTVRRLLIFTPQTNTRGLLPQGHCLEGSTDAARELRTVRSLRPVPRFGWRRTAGPLFGHHCEGHVGVHSAQLGCPFRKLGRCVVPAADHSDWGRTPLNVGLVNGQL
jgi:hypothetical protein